MKEIFARIDQDYREQVQQDTFGHLAPRKNKKYKIKLTFAAGEYDDLNPVILTNKSDCPDSPWFFDFLNEFISEKNNRETGKIWQFEGIFCNYKMTGDLVLLHDLN